MKSVDSLLSNFYHEGSWSDESSNIFLWNLSVKQGYVNVPDLVTEIADLETLSEENLASYINAKAVGASAKITKNEAAQWLCNLKKWAAESNA